MSSETRIQPPSFPDRDHTKQAGDLAGARSGAATGEVATKAVAQKQLKAKGVGGMSKPLGKGGVDASATGAQVKRSSATERTIHGNLAHQQHPSVYVVSEVCYFNGKRYLFKMAGKNH